MSSNLMRYRFGDANPLKVPWKLANAFNIGDFIYIDTADTVVTPADGTLYPGKAAGSFTWQTAIADPTSAVTIAAAASPQGPGFTVAGAGYKVAYTYVTADGLESGPNTLSAAMSTNANGINVTGVAVPAGVVAVNWYVTTDGGAAGTLQLVAQTPYGAGLTIVGPPPSDAPAPPAASSLSATLLSQVAFAKKCVGVSAQYYDGVTAAIGLKDGYFRVDSGGVFDMGCASATFNDGDLVGLAKDTGNTLNPQSVVAVTLAHKAAAIGVVRQGGATLTTVRVELFSNKLRVSQVKF